MSDSNLFDRTFQLSRDANVAAEELPKRLSALGFHQVGKRKKKKYIYLPATRRFPLMVLEYDEYSGPAPSSVLITVRQQQGAFERREEEIPMYLHDVLIDQGRARTHRKLLPSYVLTWTEWQKEGVSVYCEVLQMGRFSGSHLRVRAESEGKAAGIGALLKQLSSEPLQEAYYEDMLRELERNFPWSAR